MCAPGPNFLGPATAIRVRVVTALAACVVLAGCGRKATEADCQTIVDRNVEVQLHAMSITDPVVIAKKQEELRAEMKDGMKDCIGRRVTDSMMSCVKLAKTSDEINDCLR